MKCSTCGHRLRPYSSEDSDVLVVDAPNWRDWDGAWTGLPSPDGRWNCPPATYVTPGVPITTHVLEG